MSLVGPFSFLCLLFCFLLSFSFVFFLSFWIHCNRLFWVWDQVMNLTTEWTKSISVLFSVFISVVFLSLWYRCERRFEFNNKLVDKENDKIKPLLFSCSLSSLLLFSYRCKRNRKFGNKFKDRRSKSSTKIITVIVFPPFNFYVFPSFEFAKRDVLSEEQADRRRKQLNPFPYSTNCLHFLRLSFLEIRCKSLECRSKLIEKTPTYLNPFLLSYFLLFTTLCFPSCGYTKKLTDMKKKLNSNDYCYPIFSLRFLWFPLRWNSFSLLFPFLSLD